MNQRGVVRGVVLACLVFAAIPAAARDHAFTLNKTVKFPRGERAELDFKAGPLTFTELIVRNPPNAGDIKKAQTSDPDDNCHPKLQVGITNDGKQDMKFKIVLSLEDEAGTVYLTCNREDSIDAGDENAHTNLCWLDWMKTIDWPKLTVVRIKADIDPD